LGRQARKDRKLRGAFRVRGGERSCGVEEPLPDIEYLFEPAFDGIADREDGLAALRL
jgi:hypothetical protein